MSLFSEQGLTRGEKIQGSLSFRMGLGCCRSKTKCSNRVIDSVNTLGPQAGHREVCWKRGLPMRVGTGPCMWPSLPTNSLFPLLPNHSSALCFSDFSWLTCHLNLAEPWGWVPNGQLAPQALCHPHWGFSCICVIPKFPSALTPGSAFPIAHWTSPLEMNMSKTKNVYPQPTPPLSNLFSPFSYLDNLKSLKLLPHHQHPGGHQILTLFSAKLLSPIILSTLFPQIPCQPLSRSSLVWVFEQPPPWLPLLQPYCPHPDSPSTLPLEWFLHTGLVPSLDCFLISSGMVHR